MEQAVKIMRHIIHILGIRSTLLICCTRLVPLTTSSFLSLIRNQRAMPTMMASRAQERITQLNPNFPPPRLLKSPRSTNTAVADTTPLPPSSIPNRRPCSLLSPRHRTALISADQYVSTVVTPKAANISLMVPQLGKVENKSPTRPVDMKEIVSSFLGDTRSAIHPPKK